MELLLHCWLVSCTELVTVPDYRREALYYQSLGHYILTDYSNSRHVILVLLAEHPQDRQGLDLKRLIEEQTAKDGALGMAVLGGVVGAAVLVGSVLLKARR
jgi:fission 1 protein